MSGHGESKIQSVRLGFRHEQSPRDYDSTHFMSLLPSYPSDKQLKHLVPSHPYPLGHLHRPSPTRSGLICPNCASQWQISFCKYAPWPKLLHAGSIYVYIICDYYYALTIARNTFISTLIDNISRFTGANSRGIEIGDRGGAITFNAFAITVH